MARCPRRNHSPAFKAKVAVAAIKGEKTMIELSQDFDVHQNQIKQWRDQLLEGATGVFGEAPKAEPEPGDPVDITVRDIEDSLSKIVSDDTPDELEPVEPEDNDVPINDLIADIRRETEEMERQAEARLAGSERKARRIDPDLEETRPRFDFTNLQFGKDYDIKR